MSSKGPALFSDFGKKAKDVLNKDYTTEQKITVSTTTQSGLALTSNLVKKGGLSSCSLATQYKLKNATVDLKFDTDSHILATVSVSDLPPSTKAVASMRFPDYDSGKLEVQYFHPHASFTSAVGLNKAPAVDFSATIGTPAIAFGAEATYMIASGQFAKYDAGVSLTGPDSTTSVILADKGDAIRCSYLRNLNGGAVVGEISRKFSTNENTVTVGCLYAVDPRTLAKAKLNNHGNLGALLLHELTPKSFLTISGAFDTKALDKTPRFGLALSLKP